jgi:hypothetical protein
VKGWRWNAVAAGRAIRPNASFIGNKDMMNLKGFG